MFLCLYRYLLRLSLKINILRDVLCLWHHLILLRYLLFLGLALNYLLVLNWYLWLLYDLLIVDLLRINLILICYWFLCYFAQLCCLSKVLYSNYLRISLNLVILNWFLDILNYFFLNLFSCCFNRLSLNLFFIFYCLFSRRFFYLFFNRFCLFNRLLFFLNRLLLLNIFSWLLSLGLSSLFSFSLHLCLLFRSHLSHCLLLFRSQWIHNWSCLFILLSLR